MQIFRYKRRGECYTDEDGEMLTALPYIVCIKDLGLVLETGIFRSWS